MSDQSLLTAAALGLLEGLTEFLPVSSTGHLLLAGHFLGFESAGRAFEIVIQLGAVLAILSVYAGKLWRVFSTAHRDPQARRFIIAVAIAFLPAALIGVLAHGFIKNVLFETPMLIAIRPCRRRGSSPGDYRRHWSPCLRNANAWYCSEPPPWRRRPQHPT